MSNNDNVDLERLKLNVDVWKKIVDVQQHFNDLEMKVRNFGLLIISAFISAIGVSLKSQYEAEILGYEVPVAAFLALGALVVWMLVFLVDVYWYHPLLKGAVLKGIEIEEQLKLDLPNINLTQKIGAESAVSILGIKNVRSTTKAKIFYLGIGGVLLSIAVLLLMISDKVENEKALQNSGVGMELSTQVEPVALSVIALGDSHSEQDKSKTDKLPSTK
ncbi:hypothetical protein ACOMICROBIO_GDFFDHBD_00911 [Vibrio sp. B1REV9]|uniref:hypothetical protein n=1 Tax=Vibrio sp. B1REV9 TaxID=2751179 RepID=UPI001AFB6581|nr:hypothetical protein [Vibrio sp. B1REV9]CAE6891207.1 hypothetical protein ACOMICROBIO_GDFFDHBD_00911 [Vibrio sp. B1REV9]